MYSLSILHLPPSFCQNKSMSFKIRVYLNKSQRESNVVFVNVVLFVNAVVFSLTCTSGPL